MAPTNSKTWQTWMFAVVCVAAVLAVVQMVNADEPPAPAKDKFPPLAALGPPPIPADNVQTPDKIALGKLLYFDNRLGGDASLSCATCPAPKFGWSDGSAICRGYPRTGVTARPSSTPPTTRRSSGAAPRPAWRARRPARHVAL